MVILRARIKHTHTGPWQLCSMYHVDRDLLHVQTGAWPLQSARERIPVACIPQHTTKPESTETSSLGYDPPRLSILGLTSVFYISTVTVQEGCTCLPHDTSQLQIITGDALCSHCQASHSATTSCMHTALRSCSATQFTSHIFNQGLVKGGTGSLGSTQLQVDAKRQPSWWMRANLSCRSPTDVTELSLPTLSLCDA